jgi:endoglucanase
MFCRNLFTSLIAALGLTLLVATTACADLPPLTSDHARIVDPSGKQIVLKGCNLGNWLTLEPWMLGGIIQDNGKEYRDQAQLFRVLAERFGPDRSNHLIELYRSGYVVPRDFDLIKSFGFNVVRVPFDYRLIQDDTPPYNLRPNAWNWLDRAVQMANQAGVYVILDLHGAPGGQSKEAHTGEANQNLLWGNEPNQSRTVQLWKSIAEHYKDNPTVAAYDLLNEPYGDSRTDLRPDLAALMPKIYDAIRSTGDKHIIFFPGVLGGGITFYGDVTKKGMTNVGFTEHYYPGLFGDKLAMESHGRLMTQELPAKAAYLQQLGVPYYVGEFNVVLQSIYATDMNRAYFDRFAQYGWAGTMWSYKLLTIHGGAEPSAWYLVTNKDPIAAVDLHQSSYDDFETFFQSLGSMPLATNQAMFDALTSANPQTPALANYPQLPMPSTAKADPPGWTSIDIGDALSGETRVDPEGSVIITGGGADIFAKRDSFRFVVPNGASLSDYSAQITSLLDSNVYAKAGVMARWGDTPDAAMAMVNVFPDGTIALCSRSAEGDAAKEITVHAQVALPVELRLKITGNQATGMYRTSAGDWQTIGSTDVPSTGGFQTGLAVCSHFDIAQTVAKFRVGNQADALPQAAIDPPPDNSLLQNGSFETPGEQNDLADHWRRWGDWMNREDSWTPTHSGKALMAYHHWQIEKADTSGLFQDVDVTPGQRYTFSVFAQHDDPKGAHDATSVEIRLENTKPDGQVVLNSETFKVAELPTGDHWKQLSVSGTAVSKTVRVLIITNPSPDIPRGGAVKFDDAALLPAHDGK